MAMSKQRTYVNTDIDFERDGKQVSVLRLPYSQHSAAWGIIPIPIAVIRNGEGPTVVLTAGNHGDEYEGQIALNWLLREVTPEDVQGRVIILPAMNFPAAMAGKRVSPFDGLNLNRSFPGDPEGSPTQQIAHYIGSIILPLADAAIDLHSGGYSMDAVPAMIMYRAKSKATMDKMVAAAGVFDFSLAVVMDDLGERRTIDALCRELGIVKLGTELAGLATVSYDVLRKVRSGLRRFLHHVGVVAPGSRLILEPEPGKKPDSAEMRIVEITGPESYVYAVGNAVFEPNFALGAEVNEGEIAGWLHCIDDIQRDPHPLRFTTSGIAFCKRGPGRVMPGDAVAVVVSDARK
jgi:predicted deacylase